MIKYEPYERIDEAVWLRPEDSHLPEICLDEQTDPLVYLAADVEPLLAERDFLFEAADKRLKGLELFWLVAEKVGMSDDVMDIQQVVDWVAAEHLELEVLRAENARLKLRDEQWQKLVKDFEAGIIDRR